MAWCLTPVGIYSPNIDPTIDHTTQLQPHGFSVIKGSDKSIGRLSGCENVM